MIIPTVFQYVARRGEAEYGSFALRMLPGLDGPTGERVCVPFTLLT
jgi:hypothetical protein